MNHVMNTMIMSNDNESLGKGKGLKDGQGEAREKGGHGIKARVRGMRLRQGQRNISGRR